MAAHLGSERAPAPPHALRRRGDGGDRRAGRPARPAGARPLPGREHPGLRLWFMQARCWPPRAGPCPLVGKQLCTGLPNPQSTLIARPSLFGIGLTSERAFAWFSLGFLVVSVLIVRLWRDRGVARRLMAVRDNETGAGGHRHPAGPHQVAGLRPVGFHRRLRRGVPGLRHRALLHRPPSTRPSRSWSSPWWSSAAWVDPRRGTGRSTWSAARPSSGPPPPSSS